MCIADYNFFLFFSYVFDFGFSYVFFSTLFHFIGCNFVLILKQGTQKHAVAHKTYSQMHYRSVCYNSVLSREINWNRIEITKDKKKRKTKQNEHNEANKLKST